MRKSLKYYYNNYYRSQYYNYNSYYPNYYSNNYYGSYPSYYYRHGGGSGISGVVRIGSFANCAIFCIEHSGK
uniref:Uncharacterized protein n=1 Tax=Acrobeloides nanus TaxID=290746 RepID=A0A914CLI5_9BILA